MASSKEYLGFILEQLSELDDVSYRAMMGEYIIYYRGKIIGGIYDDRFLVKPTKSAAAMMPNLTEHQYIDDERFTRAFVMDKIRYNKWGRPPAAPRPSPCP